MTAFTQPPIILASTSKTRARLLERAGLAFKTESPGLDEAAMREAMGPEDELDPSDVAEVLARGKAEAVADSESYVIGADQVLAFDGAIFSKPADMDAARVQLLALSGQTHQLHTAVALAHKGENGLGSYGSCHAHHALPVARICRALPRRRGSVCPRVGRRLPDRIDRHTALREDRRRLLFDSRAATLAVARCASKRGACAMTKRACVIGWPVKHSRSPVIHGYWLERYGLDGAYGKEAVSPDALGSFLKDLPGRGYVGCNVTLPHKEAALHAAKKTDEAARAIGAANTLWLDAGGTLNAGNTDAYGFMTNLEAASLQWRPASGPAVVLGAGGAARAVLFGLLAAGVPRIVLANRTYEKAETLAAAFGPKVEAIAWEDRASALSGVTLLVNTTSLGMTGQPPLDIDLSALPAHAVVSDIVYVPLETRLLAEAKARGLKTVDGLGMLLHQAVPGFERWFGVRPEVTPDLRARIVATLEEA